MKFCEQPFEFFYVGPHGRVSLCAWTVLSAGNLLEDDVMDIWHSDVAEKLRESILDGSFYYCDHESCPHLSTDDLPDLDEAEIQELVDSLAEGPKRFSLAYDLTCNHKCPSCRHEICVPTREENEELVKITEKIFPYVEKSEEISSNGVGELFASENIMRVFENIRPTKSDFRISIETNGVLFDENAWKRIEHLSQYQIRVVVTPNSFHEDVYRYLAGMENTYDGLSKLINNLEFLSELRRRNEINYLQINMVMQESNFREVPEFCESCLHDFNVDKVAIKPINWWFGMTEEEIWFKDVLNPLHPYHHEYLKMKEDPRLKDPRVWDWTGGKNHEPKRHPAYRTQIYFDMMCKLLECDEPRTALAQHLKSQGIKDVVIYGTGKLGIQICHLLRDAGTKVSYFIDKHQFGKDCCGIPVKPLYGEKHNDVSCILVTPITEFDRIKRDLEKEGYKETILNLKAVIEDIERSCS